MNELLEKLYYQLDDQKEQLEELKTKMHYDVDVEDFIHLGRLSAEASEIKGKIEILTRTIQHMEYNKHEYLKSK